MKPDRPASARPNLLTYIDDLPRYGKREACLWKEGVRWRSRTYAELHRRIFACAGVLSASGLRPGDPVLIQGPDGGDWVEALFGVMRAGGVVVPLDTATQGEFRGKVAGKIGARLLVAPRSVEPPPGARRIDLGSWSAPPGAGRVASSLPAGGRVALSPGPDDRAEVIFTSGTTGEPKGVVLTHGNLVSDLAPVERAFRKWEPLVRSVGRLPFLSTLPLSHMFGQVMSVFLPLFMGFTVVFTTPRPRDVLEAARRRKAWGVFTVPRLLDLLAVEVRRLVRDEGWSETFERRLGRVERWPFYLQALAFRRVQRLFGWRFRLIVVGGAALPEAVQQFWERLGYLVVQGYGLTETAPVVSISNPFERRAGSVGRPLGILDVKLGAGNEVLVRGPNVTPGYLGSDKGVLEGGWFHTGDVGEIDDKGRLRIRGRLKEVIVTAEGENVHPADVEAAFDGVPGVREACVIGLPSEGGERVHAVLLLETGADPMDAVRAANERLMPKQRVRGHTVWPEQEFPRTSTGKVRKGIVRERAVAMQQDPAARARLSSAAFGEVRRLVAEVARVPPESLKETTLLVEGLGLASLDLVELAVALEEELGITFPEDRLARATIGDLERIARAAVSPASEPRSREARTVSAGTDGVVVQGADSGSVEEEGRLRSGSLRMPRWTRRAPVRLARRLVEETLFGAIVHFFARPEVRGLEHLKEVTPPFLLVANHHSYLDGGLFKTLLPRPLRGRIAPGMTTRHHRVFFGEAEGGLGRYMKEWFQVRLVEFLFNAWPLPETAGVRDSLSYAGELADAGFSLLIFPEGRHVPEGTIEPFRKGIGIFARELRVPVVPVYLEGTARVFPDDAWWPRFGRTRFVVGPPLWIEPETDAAEATRRVEAAVRRLATVLHLPESACSTRAADGTRK
jgi:long-chain acyl-CoA synthetase